MPIGEYTATRRRIMQAVMLGILLMSIVVASVVGRSINRANRIELSSQPIIARDVSIRMPLHWTVVPPAGNDPRVIARAVEPAAGGAPGRAVEIILDRLDVPASPLRYLHDQLGVYSPQAPDIDANDLDAADNAPSVDAVIPVGAASGVLVGGYHMVSLRAADGSPSQVVQKDLYAAAVFPSMQALVVHLTGSGAIDALDTSAVTKIAAGLKLDTPASVEPADAILTLPAGIELQPPAEFDAIVQSDPNRTDRLFWPAPRVGTSVDNQERTFTAIEVVGCYFPSLVDNDPKRTARATLALQALLLVRDPRWRNAHVISNNGAWIARPDAPAEPATDDYHAAAAYLLPDPSGRAVLAIFHGGRNGGSAFDSLWADLQARIKFLSSSDIAQLEDAGATESARLVHIDWNKRLNDPDSNHGDLWFQRIDQSNQPHIGWSSVVWQTTKLAADVDLRQRDPSGEIARVAGQWKIDGPQKYAADLTLTATRGELSYSMQQSIVRDGAQLTMHYRLGKLAPQQWSMPVPAQFVPGQLLPLIMGDLSAGPMLLKTESFLTDECDAAPELLAVTIRPGPATARKADGDEHPMRCVTAEVNGSGAISRWYFNAAGELESVELPGGVRRLPSDIDHIRFDFGKTGPMAP